MRLIRSCTFILSALMMAAAMLSVQAHESIAVSRDRIYASSPIQVNGQLTSPAAGVVDIKFNELFKMPVGPRGMEPSDKLLSLDSRPVRIIGYMAKQETPTPGMFIVSPLPVNMGDEDDKFADDMPANSIFVHLDNPDMQVNYVPGLVNLTGVLSLGNKTETDGRVSFIRIQLNPEISRLLAPGHQTGQQASK